MAKIYIFWILGVQQVIKFDSELNALESFRISFHALDFEVCGDCFVFYNLDRHKYPNQVICADKEGKIINCFIPAPKSLPGYFTGGGYLTKVKDNHCSILTSASNFIYDLDKKECRIRDVTDYGKYTFEENESLKNSSFMESACINTHCFVVDSMILNSFFIQDETLLLF